MVETNTQKIDGVNEIWDDVHVKALLHLPRFPIRLIQQDPWQAWIGRRGGLRSVLTYLQNYPMCPTHRRILDVVLENPEAIADVYADQLNVSRATYFYQLREFTAVLVQALNQWEIEPTTDALIETDLAATIPQPLNPIVGAESTLAQLMQLVGKDSVRLISVVGPGGVGKTRLSIELALRCGRGVCFVNLSTARDEHNAVEAICRALGLNEFTESSLIEWLRPRRVLIILDNFEQIIAAKGLISRLLQGAPCLKVLVTTRISLSVYGEHEVVVSSLPVITLEERQHSGIGTQAPAVELFVQRAKAVNPSFQLDSSNAGAIAEICVFTDGLPLAIEFAASQMKYLSAHGLVDQLVNDGCLNVVGETNQAMPEHQQGLRAVHHWSFDLLPKRLRVALCQLSVYPKTFDFDVARAICGPENLRENLMALVDHSLLIQSLDPDGKPEFRMLTVTREFCGEWKTSQVNTGYNEIKDSTCLLYWESHTDENGARVMSETALQTGQRQLIKHSVERSTKVAQ